MSLMNTWILAMKVLVISAGALFVALGIKTSVPAAVNDAPAVWSAVLSWLKPPYLYAIVNGIIITIVASSRFQQIGESDPPLRGDRHLISVRTPPPAEFAALSAEPDIKNVLEERKAAVVVYESGDRIVELKPVMVNGSRVVDSEDEEERIGDSDDDDKSDGFLLEATERISPEFLLEYTPPAEEEKPPVPSRRSNRRKPNATTAREAPKLARHDTLESVWKMIMDARDESLAHANDPPASISSSFQKEPSPSQDEVNRRAEDFIRKFNEEMRQQRQKSLDRHIGDGAHT